jgi:hypothetical protein
MQLMCNSFPHQLKFQKYLLRKRTDLRVSNEELDLGFLHLPFNGLLSTAHAPCDLSSKTFSINGSCTGSAWVHFPEFSLIPCCLNQLPLPCVPALSEHLAHITLETSVHTCMSPTPPNQLGGSSHWTAEPGPTHSLYSSTWNNVWEVKTWHTCHE